VRGRLTLGGWSWAGVAGLLITFDSDPSDVEPSELRATMDRIGQRLTAATPPATGDRESRPLSPVPGG